MTPPALNDYDGSPYAPDHIPRDQWELERLIEVSDAHVCGRKVSFVLPIGVTLEELSDA